MSRPLIATSATPAETRILVVDDDSMMRFTIAGCLEDSGYTVCEAGDALAETAA